MTTRTTQPRNSLGFLLTVSGIAAAISLATGIDKAARADGDASSKVAAVRNVYNSAKSRIAEMKQRGASTSLSQAESLNGTLYGQMLKLSTAASKLFSKDSEIAQQKSTVSNRKSDYEYARRAYDRVKREYDSKLAANQAEIKTHNARYKSLQRRTSFHNSDATAQRKAIQTLSSEQSRYSSARSAHERRRQTLNRGDQNAVNQFNAEVDRLNAWLSRLKTRTASVNNWGRRVNARKREIDRDASNIQSNASRLNRAKAAIIAREGKKLIDARLKTSKTYREYDAARTALAKLMKEHSSQLTTFNALLAEANTTIAGLNQALGTTSVVGRTSQPAPTTRPDPKPATTAGDRKRAHIESVTKSVLAARGRTMVVTSRYRAGSAAHRRGAIDISSKDLSSPNRLAEAKAISRALGAGYTVIVEEVSSDRKTQTNTSYRDGRLVRITPNMPRRASATHTHIQPDQPSR